MAAVGLPGSDGHPQANVDEEVLETQAEHAQQSSRNRCAAKPNTDCSSHGVAEKHQHVENLMLRCTCGKPVPVPAGTSEAGQAYAEPRGPGYSRPLRNPGGQGRLGLLQSLLLPRVRLS